MMLQQLSNDIAGAFRLGDTVDPSSVDTRLPVPAANMAIRWNNLANALENFQLAATGAITLPGGNGFVVETGGGTGVFTNRTLQQGAGLNIANGDGQAGDPTFSIPDDGIQGNMLDDGIVSNPHIKDLTITAPKMADDSVIGRMIDDLVVSNPHIVNLTIDDTKMADDSVVGRMIDDQVVSNPHIVNLTITGAKIGDGEITGQKLGTGTLETLDVEQVDQVISSLTLTPIFSHTIPANTLLSVRAVLFDAIVVINNAAVAQNITFDLRYGGSSIGTVVVNVPVATVYCEIKGILQAKGATNAQRGQLRAMVDQVNTGEVVDIVSANLAVDSTSNQTFEVRAQLANVTGSDVTLHSGTLVLAKP
jgi:phospholipid N-methyltransferase